LSISPHRGDFVGEIVQLNSTIQGISTVTKIEGVGTVRWTFKDVFGTFKIIETRVYYIPDAGVCLFSPQVYFQEQHASSYSMTPTNTVLTTYDGCALTLGYQLDSNMPMVPPPSVCVLSRVDHSRVNLSLRIFRLTRSPAPFRWSIRRIKIYPLRKRNSSRSIGRSVMWTPNAYKRLCIKLNVSTKHPGTRSCKPPRCAVCCLAKALIQGSDTYSTILTPKKVNALVREDLKPGDRVSLDQYVMSFPGRLAAGRARMAKRKSATN
jgi:hypothetical protein